MMRLLIISSSKAQASVPAIPIEALERYRGLAFGVIRKLRGKGKLPKDLEIMIVSARFGLIGPEEKIPYVDQIMTYKSANELRKGFHEKLKAKFDRVKFSDIFVNLGAVYEKSIEGFEKFVDAKVTYASGTLGKRAKQMKQWILKVS